MIVAENLTKHYGARVALAGVEFEIPDKQVVGFLGLNGAGKTTLLKILAGLLLPSEGRVVVSGTDAREDPRAHRQRVGFLPDRPPLYGDMSVKNFLRYAAGLWGVRGQAQDKRVEYVLEQTQLKEREDELIDWLSHGYRQRVGIAQAIIHQPDFVILDEPINGLDPEQIVGMRDVIQALREEHTVLVSSHILSEISQTCDQLLVLREGVIVARGSEESLRQRGNDVRVRLELRGTLDTLRAAFESVDDVGEPSFVSQNKDSDEGDSTWWVEASVKAAPAREALVQSLVAHGVGVRSFSNKDSELEEIFLTLTRGEG